MKRKFIFCIFILLFLLSSSVFATDSILTTTSATSNNLEMLNSDLFSSEKDCTIDNKINGNVFNSSNNCEISSNSVVEGSVFLAANTVSFKSDVSYADTLSKDNEPAINKINSFATINGNAFVVCNKFTLETGVQIYGDLYIIAKEINIQKSSVIHGNLFATCNNISLNGRVENSVYISSNAFNMNYYGSIYKDLHLSAKNANLNSVIRRNVSITSDEIFTGKDFLTYGNLEAHSNTFNFSGEIDGNALINSKNLNFINSKDDTNFKCLIKGNLNYSSLEKTDIDNSIVNGEVNYSVYEEKDNTEKSSFSFKAFVLNLLTFMLYTFVVACIFTLIRKNHLLESKEINFKNIAIALGIGILTIFIVIIIGISLLLSKVGAILGLTLIFAYILLLFLSVPIFVLDIANLLKEKLNLYLGILLSSLILFLISQIPYLGSIIMFLFINIGSGRIVKRLITKKK